MSSESILAPDHAIELITGLMENPRRIPSKFFYDDEGSRIFRRIMDMPEYYLSNCESEVLTTWKEAIMERICQGQCSIDVVELGAGDGSKTRILLAEILKRGLRTRYIPIDISQEAVDQLSGIMTGAFPELVFDARVGDYFHMLEDLVQERESRKLILFLGSNLGNFSHEESIAFLSSIARSMSEKDLLFLGLDLKKEPALIRRAYDDPHGHTRAFNLNLLQRMNRELGADFRLEHFAHRPDYDPESGIASSALESLCDQEVHFRYIGEEISFSKGERIHTEISRKYDLPTMEALARESGFRPLENYFDSRHYYLNTLWEKQA